MLIMDDYLLEKWWFFIEEITMFHCKMGLFLIAR